METRPLDRRDRFERLAAAVFDPVQRYVRRRASADLADDAFAEIMLVLWRRLDDVPPDEPLPWCYGVARRCLANGRRSHVRRQQLATKLAADPTVVVDGGAWFDDARDPTDGLLHDALARLNDADRELVQLWAWEGLEPRAIAVVLDSTPNAISIRLHRVRRRLADDLGKDRRSAGHDHGTRHGEEQR